VRNHGLGQVTDAVDLAAATEQLVGFIGDRAARAACGAAGRRLAEEQFEIGRFRSWINARLSALVRPAVSVARRKRGPQRPR